MDLTPAMERALHQYNEQGNFEGVHHRTLAALERRALVEKTDNGGYVVRESAAVPRDTQYVMRWRDNEYALTPTHDPFQPDYFFWDRVVRGKQDGLKIAGLFLKSLGSKIAAWLMGDAPDFQFENDANQENFNKWWQMHHSDTLRALEESINKGDSYVVINPPDEKGDLSVTVLPGHVVHPIVDENDFSKRIGWKVVEVHPHPNGSGKSMTIVDEYYADRRVRKMIRHGTQTQVEEYPNLIGMEPVIHIPNNRGADEMFGHAEGEALLQALTYYDELFRYAAAGNRRQGRPTPVIEKMGSQQNIDYFWKTFGRQEKYKAADGADRTRWTIDLDSDQLMTLGGDATFNWRAPGSFSSDTVALLGLLFYLILQHTELPEFIWGNAIASSKASADSQMEPFVKFIGKRRGECAWWMLQMARIVIAYQSLYETGMDVNDTPTIKWSALTKDDGTMTLNAIRLGLDKGLLDDETALSLMPLDIPNPREVLDKLKAELEQKRQEYLEHEEDLVMNLQEPEDDAPDTTSDEAEVGEVVRMARRIIREQTHTGAMCAFMVPTDPAAELREAALFAGLEDVTEIQDMHLTLVYMGRVDDIDVTLEDVRTALEGFVESHAPIEGITSGVGRFNNSERDGTTAVYASFDSPELPEFRQDLIEALEDAGIAFEMNHGFTPHITLGYMDDEGEMPDVRVPEIDITFNRITLAWGDERIDLRLTNEERETA